MEKNMLGNHIADSSKMIKCIVCGEIIDTQIEYVNGFVIDINNAEEHLCEDCRDNNSDCLEDLFETLLNA